MIALQKIVRPDVAVKRRQKESVLSHGQNRSLARGARDPGFTAAAKDYVHV